MTKEILFNNLQFIIQDQFICCILRISYYVYHISQVSEIKIFVLRLVRSKLVQTGSNQFQTGSKYSSIFNIPNLQYHYTILYVIPALKNTKLHASLQQHEQCTLQSMCVVHAGSDLVNRKHHSVESTKFILLVQIYILFFFKIGSLAPLVANRYQSGTKH